MRWPRWAIPLPAILLSFFPQIVNAEPTPGLATTYYTINAIPPIQSTSEYPVCGSETENNINRNYDGELFEDCTGDLFMVHMAGYVNIPEHQTIEFMIASDDGGEITIDGNKFGVWYDQGCTWTMSGPLELNAESVPLELYMYDNGGGACLMLAWKIDDGDWTIVPDEAFTTSAVSQTTSTTSSTTTSSTSTTFPETNTSSSTTSILLETTTTQVESSTTIAFSSTTTLFQESSTTNAPIPQSTTTSVENTTTNPTTTTELPYTSNQTSTTTPTIYPQPEPTINETDTAISEPETFTTYLPDPLEESVEPDTTTIPEITVPDRVDEILLDETERPQDISEPQEDITETEQEQAENSSWTTLPQLTNTIEEVNAILETDLTNSELKAVLNAVFDGELSDAETLGIAEELLSQPLSDDEFVTVLDAIFDEVASDEVLIAVFETILATELTVERFADLVNVLEVSDAISSEQVAEVVTLVLAQDGGVTDSQATELASSPKVLESIDGEQAIEVFDAIVASGLSVEQGSLIVEALLQASTEVKKSFEKEINVFEGVFDDYVATGSVIDVGTRRAIVAGVAIVFVAPMTPISSSFSRVKS